MATTSKKKTNPIYYLLIIILALALGFILWLTQTNPMEEEHTEKEKDYHQITYNDEDYHFNTSTVSILLLGLDTTDKTVGNGQADALQLLVLNRQRKSMSLVAIPRDVITPIRMFDLSGNDLGWHEEHLNLAYGYANNPRSGCLYTAQAVSSMLFDIPINYYGAFKTTSLEKVMTVVDNQLEVVVPNDSLVELNPEWQEGTTITLTKDNVELFLRSRDIEKDFSNTSRMERQKVFMISYFDKIKSLLKKDFDSVIKKVYYVVNDITTNITFDDMKVFMEMVVSFDFDEKKDFYTLHGTYQRGEYHDEYILDEQQARELVIKLFYVKEEETT